MRNWFFERYENPVEHCPYDEGEYIYIYGGPYYASDEIHSEFDGVFPEKAVEEVIENLNLECNEWSGVPSDDWYCDEFEFQNPFDNYKSQILQIKELSELLVKPDLENSFYKMLYVNIITILETYLRDNFVKNLYSGDYLKKFIETNTDIRKKNYKLCNIYQHYNLVNEEIKSYINEILWHNLSKVSEFYKFTFSIDFPEIVTLNKDIAIRHDIVHRNGKNKDNIEFYINKETVIELLQKVEKFIVELEQNFNNKARKEEIQNSTQQLLEDF